MQIAKPNQFQEAMAVLAICIYKPNERNLSKIAKEYHNDNSMALYLERIEGRIVGIIGIKKQNASTYEIKHIAVIQGYREKGIAKNMIKHVIKKHDIKRLFAETDKDTVDFYRKCGFTIDNLGEKYPKVERYMCTKVNSMKNEIKIRVSKRTDAQVIGAMAKEFAGYLRALGDKTKFRFNSKTYMRDGFGRNPAFKGLITEVNGKTAGYLLYLWGYDTDRAVRIIHILDLFIREEYRRQGIGQACMKRIISIAKEGDAKMLIWEVHASNHNARKFYWGFGARYIKNMLMMKLPVK